MLKLLNSSIAMRFQLGLSSTSSESGSGALREQNMRRNRLRKAPPAPDIVSDPKIRGRLGRRAVHIPTVLSKSYEKCKARFTLQRKKQGANDVGAPRKDPSLDSMSRPFQPPSIITGADNVSNTSPQPLHKDDSTFIRKDSPHSTLEHTISANNETANPDERIEVTKPTASPPNTSPMVDSESQTDPPRSPSVTSSDGEASSTGSSKKSHTTSDTSDSPDDVGLCRADWEPLKILPHLNFLKVLSQHVGGSIETADADYEYVNASQGGYNYVRIYDILTGPSAGRYVIKVPCVGTAARWQDKDAYMLRSEFGTIKLIRERTNCPVPEVIAYSDSLENDLGAPFILMKACTGRCAVEVWHDADDTNRWNAEDIDVPSASLSSKRARLLSSLAHAMAKLQKLEFDKIGVLDFDNIDTDGSSTVGPGWLWSVPPDFTEEDLLTDKPHFELPVHESSCSLFAKRLLKEWPYNALDGERVMIIHHLMDTFFRSEPFAKSIKPGNTKETFVLRHDDLDLQNIFCDPDTGEVICIIDWERASTAPRCLGYASLPIFLTLDWYPEYSVYDDEVHNPFALTLYRKIYAMAMIEATGEEVDGKYTYKSAMYQAAHAALYGSNLGGSISDFVRKMLCEIPELNHVDINVFSLGLVSIGGRLVTLSRRQY